MTKRKRKEKHPLDELKTQIDAIQHGVRLIRESGISDHALYLLIQRAAPAVGRRYTKAKPSISMIKAVLAGMDRLKEYVFPEEDDAEHD